MAITHTMVHPESWKLTKDVESLGAYGWTTGKVRSKSWGGATMYSCRVSREISKKQYTILREYNRLYVDLVNMRNRKREYDITEIEELKRALRGLFKAMNPSIKILSKYY